MAAPRIKLRRLVELTPSATNARTHSDAQVNQIVASLQMFGFTNPVLVDQDGIVAGHGRVLAVKRVEDAGGALRFPGGDPIPAGMVPTIDVTGWSPDQRRAYMLADNQLALNAGWDTDILQAELDALAGMDFALTSIGFDEGALAALITEDAGGAGRGAPNVLADSTYQHADQYGVIVVCKNEADQEAVFNRLRDEGLNVKVVVV